MQTNVDIKVKVNASTIRKEKHDGKSFLIAPAVLLVEGVHNGNGPGGALYYPSKVLEQFAFAWNDIPVMINHPQSKDGEYVLCKECPDITISKSIGRTYNSGFKDSKLKSELWLDVEKTNGAYPSLAQGIINNDDIEVSTGILLKIKEEKGKWNDEEYDGVVLEMVPDHLAILPETQGACSYEDGCGIRTNEAKSKVKGNIYITNKDEKSLMELLSALEKAVSAGDGQNQYSYIYDVYDKFVIYSRSTKGDAKYYKVDYTYKDGEAILGTNLKEVEIVKTYKELNKEAKGTMCCEERIDALIANEDNPYSADDKEWLSSLNEEQFAKIEETAHKEVKVENTSEETNENEGEGEGGETPAMNEEKKKITIDDLDDSTKATIVNYQKFYNEQKAKVIEKIIANEKNTYTKEELMAKDIDELKKIVNFLPVKETPAQNFSGANVGFASYNTEKDVEVLETPTVEDMIEKK